MKKILFLSALFLFALAACNGARELENTLDEIELEDEATDALTLPESKDGHDIVWESHDENLIDNEGNVFRPSSSLGDMTVRLDATIEDGEYSATRTFSVTVLAYSSAEEALNEIELPGRTDEDLTLPEEIDGHAIEWSGDAYIDDDGSVERPSYDTGDQTAELIASTDDAERTIEITVTALSAFEDAVFNFELPEQAQEAIELPDEFEGYDITWTVEEGPLDIHGNIDAPYHGEEDEDASLKGEFTDGQDVITRSFDVAIPAYSQEKTGEFLASAIDTVSIEETITETTWLPTRIEGYHATWEADEPLITENFLTRPEEDDKDTYLTLTLNAGDVEYSETFTTTITPYAEEEADAAAAVIDVISETGWAGETVEDSLPFPETENGVAFEWTSSDPAIITQLGEVQPPLSEDGDQSVELIAETTYEDIEKSFSFEVYVEAEPPRQIVEARTLGFENLADEYHLDSTDIDIFYTDDKSLPYVDLTEFLNLLDGGESKGAIHFDELDCEEEDNTVTFTYEAEAEDDVEDLDTNDEDETVEYTFTIDFDTNEAVVSHADFFSAFQAPTETDFGEDLNVVDYEQEFEDPVTFDLTQYRLPLFIEEDRHLLPLHVANLFLSGSMFDVYYNGDDLYGIDTYQLMDDDDLEDTLRQSGYNREDMPEHLQKATYDYLAFSFDYYYGLKEDQGVDTYYNIFEREEFTAEDRDHYDNLFDLAYDMDDLHTDFIMAGPFDPDYSRALDIDDFGPRGQNFYNTMWETLPEEFCEPDGIVYMDEGRVARIPLLGFDEDTPDAFADYLDEIDEKGTVEEIIVDLSCNTGGVMGGMIQTIGYMTDEDIPINQLNTLDQSTSTVYYESDVEARDDYEWHVLVSPVTYSAANVMAQIVQEMEIATVVGERPTGGASSITTNLTPSGAILLMSSPSVFTDEHYDSIEFGVEVDAEITAHNFRSDARILSTIEEAKEE